MTINFTYGDDRNNNLRAKSFLPAASTFPGLKTHVMVISWRVWREKGEQWAITNKLDSNIERDTECLYNMLNSLFCLIREKEKSNMTLSELVGSPPGSSPPRTPFVSLFLIPQPHNGVICYLLVI